jgi:hypothetical protein
MIARIMPVFFGFIGINFPAGLVVYWTTTNLVQVVQQHFMLPKREPSAGGDGKAGADGGKRRAGDGKSGQTRPGGKGALPGKGQPRAQGGGSGGDGKGRAQEQGEAPSSGGGPGRQTGGGAGGRPGGNDAGNRKKRRKR